MIIILELVEVRLSCWVYLEHFDLLETWANIFCHEFAGLELLVEKPVSEHHFSPDVKVLLERAIELPLTFILYPQRIEDLLRNSDKWGVVTIISKRYEILCGIIVEILWNPRNESDHGPPVAIHHFDETKIVLIDASVDSNPLVDLEPLLLNHSASFHDLSHFIDGDHGNRSMIDSTQTLENFFNMLGFVCLTVDYS